jgi:glutamyl-tRNA reductase
MTAAAARVGRTERARSHTVMPGAQLVVVGLDHATAPIGLRERVAFAGAEVPAALARLTDRADPLLEQAAILSTCNRVEVYGATRSPCSGEELTAFLARYHGLDPHELEGCVYVHRDAETAHHLAATAAGMQSLVLGEAQIQGQVRRALQYAVAAGTAGTEVRRLFESAISAGRRVRSRTALALGVASVSQASVELIRRRLGTLSQSTVLLLGAGTTGELVVKHLIKHRPRELLILGRGSARAGRLAARYGGRALTSDQLGEALARSDVVISSTSAPHAIIHTHQVTHALADHRGPSSRPLLMIDLATPRDIEPAVARLIGAELYTIDDLRPVVEQTLTERSAELPAAYSIVCAETARYTQWLRRRETAAKLRSLSTEVEQARATAQQCTLEQLPPLSRDDRERLDGSLAQTALQPVEPRFT